MKLYTPQMFEECCKLLMNFNIPTTFLEKSIEIHFKNKLWMIERFKFKIENDYRIRIPMPLPTSEVNYELWDFVCKVCEVKSKETGNTYTPIDFTFIQDSRKNKFKFTKIFLSILDVLWEKHLHGTIRWFDRILNKSGCIAGTESNDIAKKRTAVSLPIWYGDQILGNRNVVFSLLPIDFLGASTNAKASSCYRPGGEYFNGVLTNLASPNVLVSFVENNDSPGYKIGRSWYYVNDTVIIQGRLYGSIFPEHHLHLRNYLEGCMGGNWVVKSEAGINERVLISDGPSYIDNGHGMIIVNKHMDTKVIRLPQPICLQCGGYMSYEMGRVSGKCGHCNEGDYNYSETQAEQEDEFVDAIPDYVCEHCGEGVHEDEVYNFDNCTYCEQCFDDLTTVCYYCDARIWNEDSYGTSEGDVCHGCYESEFFTCVYCEEVVHNSSKHEKENGDYICDHCFKTNYFICEECGGVYNKTERCKLGIMFYCEACFNDISEKGK